MKILLATHNEGKVREFKEMFSSLEIEFISLNDLNDHFEISETGQTFRENAYLKAKYYFDKYQMPVLADDSGLVVEALNGLPGVISARFSGKNSNSYQNNLRLLDLMKNQTNKDAYFVCILCFISKEGQPYFFRGSLEGKIIEDMRGENGFGYDPLFYLPAFEMTLAEMKLEDKIYLSHRYDAAEKFIKFLQKGQ